MIKTYGKYKRVSIKNLKVGDKIAICSIDNNFMKPNKEKLVKIDEERLELLLDHQKLNFVFATIDGMKLFCENYNRTVNRVLKYF